MGKAFEAGMVLVMSLWDDYYANALWLDSTYPTDGDATSPGVARGLVPRRVGFRAMLRARMRGLCGL